MNTDKEVISSIWGKFQKGDMLWGGVWRWEEHPKSDHFYWFYTCDASSKEIVNIDISCIIQLVYMSLFLYVCELLLLLIQTTWKTLHLFQVLGNLLLSTYK